MQIGDGIEVIFIELYGIAVSKVYRVAIVEIIEGDVLHAKLRRPLDDGATHVKVHISDRGQTWR